jgi:hypothetical protein
MSIRPKRNGLKIVKKVNEDNFLKVRVEILKEGSIDLQKADITKYEFKKLPFVEKVKIVKRNTLCVFDADDIFTDIEIMDY